VRAALGRFLAWHYANPRQLVGVEQRFTSDVELPDGARVVLYGYADRLELDLEGHIVVVDLKTGRGLPSQPDVDRNLQLALYQYAVDNGAVDHSVAEALGTEPAALTSGGAELLQLGQENGSESPVVQPQAVANAESPTRNTLTAALGLTADLIRTESFPAISGAHCKYCDFVPICPIKSAGPVIG
jgi:RecB family exonuclease